MKNSNSIFSKQSVLVILLLSIFGLGINSCSKKINFQQSSIVPAAEGKVKVTKDNNKNYRISIELVNLATVKRLDLSEKQYVIWMESEEQTTKNIGQLNSSKNFLSNKYKASFHTVSTFKPSGIFITAEEDGNVQHPSGSLILTTGKF